jgi:5-carboxymethyl-2-hydroxymuconate isomerase
MPHLAIDYTANLDTALDMNKLCSTLAAELVAMRNAENGPLFPLAGTRVMARPAPYFAVADGQPGKGFIYMNLKIAPGRSEEVKTRVGQSLLATAMAFLEPVFASQPLGLTLHIDDVAPSFDGKHNNLASKAASA